MRAQIDVGDLMCMTGIICCMLIVVCTFLAEVRDAIREQTKWLKDGD